MVTSVRLHFKLLPHLSVAIAKLHVSTRTGSDAYFSVYLFCVLRKLIKQPFHRIAPQSVGRSVRGVNYTFAVSSKGAVEQVVCVCNSYAASVPGKGKYKMGVTRVSFWSKDGL